MRAGSLSPPSVNPSPASSSAWESLFGLLFHGQRWNIQHYCDISRYCWTCPTTYTVASIIIMRNICCCCCCCLFLRALLTIFVHSSVQVHSPIRSPFPPFWARDFILGGHLITALSKRSKAVTSHFCLKVSPSAEIQKNSNPIPWKILTAPERNGLDQRRPMWRGCIRRLPRFRQWH